MSIKIKEMLFSMLPSSQRRLTYKDGLILDDNFEEDITTLIQQIVDNITANFPIQSTFISVLLCTKGYFNIRLNLKDYTLCENDILVVLPNTIVEYLQYSSDAHVGIMVLSNSFSSIFANDMPVSLKKHFISDAVMLHLSCQYMQHILTLYKMVRYVIEEAQFMEKEKILKGYLDLMGCYALQFIEANNLNKKKLPHNEEIFYRFIDLVKDNYHTQRSIGFYADKMCLSAKYLSRIITQESSRHPSEWIRDYVILEAKTMLRTHKYTIGQISEELNFPNQSFFGKYFKQSVGCSPAKFQTGANIKE